MIPFRNDSFELMGGALDDKDADIRRSSCFATMSSDEGSNHLKRRRTKKACDVCKRKKGSSISSHFRVQHAEKSTNSQM